MSDAEALKLKDFGNDDGLGITVFETTHSGVKPHTHTFYELVYISGGFCLHETGSRTALLLEGDFF
ncbi:MAG: AraC family ligand binding domain-containing protein [Clostridia bacterium]|nr:AraC family ligand binding domain-containing protein [Clostridia bacterium]